MVQGPEHCVRAGMPIVAPLFDPAATAIAAGVRDFDQIAQNARKVMADVREVGPMIR
jgi:hypothetical protein